MQSIVKQDFFMLSYIQSFIVFQSVNLDATVSAVNVMKWHLL